MVTPYRVRCSVIDNEVYIAPVAYGRSDLASLVLSRSVCSYRRVPCFQSSSFFRAVFAFGFAALRKLGWKRAGHAASAKSSLSLIKGWCRMWCQSIILSTYLFFLVLRIRCLHYKLRISHWELWSLHAISIRYVQHYHHRWSCWPWTPTRNLRLIYSW